MVFDGLRANAGAAVGGVEAGAKATGDLLAGSGASGKGLLASIGSKAVWVAEASANIVTKPLAWAGNFMKNNPRGAKMIAGVGLAYGAYKGVHYLTHKHDTSEMPAPVMQMDQMNTVNGQLLDTMQAAQSTSPYTVSQAQYLGKGVSAPQMALAGGYTR